MNCMGDEQLIDKIQNLLLGMEERTNVRFDKMDTRFDGVEVRLDKVEVRLDKVESRLDKVESRLGAIETKVDSVARELTLNTQLLGPFIHWSHSVEDEIIRLSAQLQEVQARLAKLENLPAQ